MLSFLQLYQIILSSRLLHRLSRDAVSFLLSAPVLLSYCLFFDESTLVSPYSQILCFTQIIHFELSRTLAETNDLCPNL